ncbi:TlpA disulfide reductase family protein [uncultured Chryseobacterium sp.]|uniref:TlpA family protein disulfide reductase n=1 Tax=uncultured Chryseobacterium sp. TaxID=259322 RepID=UPI0025DC22F5|nr:TlpA disulfide reductase family protein [uncultured Chryseobacterium sp.]
MKKVLLPVICFINTVCFSQNTRISGKSFRPFKYKIVISNAFNDKYYNGNSITDSAAVQNGTFDFTVPSQTADIPYAYRFNDKISAGSFFQSDVFFIDSKTKYITVGKEGDPQNFEIISNSQSITGEMAKMQAYFSEFNKEKQSFYDKSRAEYEKFPDKQKIPQKFWDSYQAEEKKFSVKEDLLLSGYVKENRNSFTGLWKLIEKFERNGYEPAYETIFNDFSPEIKRKKTAETLRMAIKNAADFRVGNRFPGSKIKDIKNPGSVFSIPPAKYTLVDFWFSSCKPCLEQMPLYADLYSQYHPKGFQIIGIATDQDKYKSNLLKTIGKFNIPWTNYWDTNGRQSSEWTITSFPTNYLLDENGKIVFKNITEKELSELLEKKLK